MRTYSPSALPHLALAAVVLVVPLPLAPVVAVGFAVGRFAMPVLSNAWSDDGSWTGSGRRLSRWCARCSRLRASAHWRATITAWL
jgi:hypothetical protein